MRFLLLLAFLFVIGIAKATDKNDTIPYWHISYGKTVVIQGNIKSAGDKIYEITLKQGVLKDLTVSFVYGSNQPKSSSLVVKEKNEVLRTVEQDQVMGPYFVVPVRELIGTHQPNVQYKLEFYYTDDRGQKDLKLGTLLFIFQ
jgi:hypothetical protein